MSSKDLIDRTNKSRSPMGNLTFVGLRGLDPLLQYQILVPGGLGSRFLSKLSVRVNAMGPISNTSFAIVDRLELSPYRLVLLSMACVASAKHIIWKLFIGQEQMPPVPSAVVGVFNSVWNSANTLLFLAQATSAATAGVEGPPWDRYLVAPLLVGSVLFATGITVELLSEFQRKAFKDNLNNQGKPYTGGLFALARHINYGGYTLWRTGFAVAAAGWTWGAVSGGFFFWDFASRAVPSLQEYCQTRYGDLWKDYEAKTPYRLLPYIY